jgi:ABC-type Fe3+/spermidine/putrescine transport system ATPase subunit
VSGYRYEYLRLDKSKLEHSVLNTGILLQYNYTPVQLYNNPQTQAVNVYKKDHNFLKAEQAYYEPAVS